MSRIGRLLAMVLSLNFALAFVSTAAEPPKTGEKRDTLLYVRTVPPGAKVLLDGKELGTSDDLFSVGPGVGRIVIELEGYQPGDKQVTIKANAVTRLELTLKRQAEAPVTGKQPAPAASEPRLNPGFIGRLPHGAVELIGITKYPATDQSQWWRPDGTAAQLPFLPQPTQWTLSADRKPFVFLLRTENLPADASWPAWKIEPCTGNWGATGVTDANRAQAPGLHMFCAEIGASAATADFRVGVSMGAWETVITQKADGAGTSSFSRDGQQWTVTFLKAESAGRMADDSTRVILRATDSYGKWNKRLVAVANNGSEHAASIGFKGEDGAAYFEGLPLPSVKEFRYQVRP